MSTQYYDLEELLLDQPVTCRCRMCGTTWVTTMGSMASREICSAACGRAYDDELAAEWAAHTCDPDDPYCCRE